MKYIVTATTLSRRTRRRVGRAFTEVVEYDGLTPKEVEEAFQTERNARPGAVDVKVVDVRPVEDGIPEGGAPLDTGGNR